MRIHRIAILLSAATYILACSPPPANTPEKIVTPEPETPAPPQAPTGLTAAGGDATVTLSWNTVAEADSYKVYRSTDANDDFAAAKPLASVSAAAYEDVAVSNGTTYYYVVRAEKDALESANSNIASAEPVAEEIVVDPPGQVLGAVAEAGDGQVTLIWNADADAVSYEVLSGTVSGGPYLSIATPTAPNYVDASVSNGTTYYYVIRAINAGGTGPESVEVNAQPLPPLPGVPAGVVATAGHLQIGLTWSASSRADDYAVYAGTTSADGPFSQVAITTGTDYNYTSLTNGTPYYIRIRARNLAGYAESITVSATPLPPLPSAPWAVTSAAGDKTVSVYWMSATQAASYAVYAATAPTGPYSLAGVTTSVSLEMTDLTNWTTYYYKVRSINLAGYAESASISATPWATEVCVYSYRERAIFTVEAMQDADVTPLRSFGRVMVSPADMAIAGDEIYVLDSQKQAIVVFSRDADGAALPLRTIAGPDTGLESPLSITVDTGRNEIFVGFIDAIRAYPRSATGNVTPLRVISGPNTQLCQLMSIALDPADEMLVALNRCDAEITKYDVNSDGDQSPFTILNVTGVNSLIDFSIDNVRREAVLLSETTLFVVSLAYAASASPLRQTTGFTFASGVAVDAVNAKVYVSSNAGYWVMATDAANVSEALFSVTNASDSQQTALAVDGVADEVLMSDDYTLATFASDATGDATPLRRISEESKDFLDFHDLVVEGDEIFAFTNDGPWPHVTVYSQTLEGFTFAPLRQILGPSSGVTNIQDVTFDANTAEFFVLDGDDKILVFDATASGDLLPLRVIEGANTLLSGPAAIALNPNTNELFVSHYANASILVFPADASGDVDPVRMIAGGNTTLSSPIRLGVAPAHNELFVYDSNTVTLHTFAADATDTAPLRSLTGAATQMTMISDFTYDAKTDTLVVGEESVNALLLFDREANGDVAPAIVSWTGEDFSSMGSIAICR